jgi:hypothetical protein
MTSLGETSSLTVDPQAHRTLSCSVCSQQRGVLLGKTKCILWFVEMTFTEQCNFRRRSRHRREILRARSICQILSLQCKWELSSSRIRRKVEQSSFLTIFTIAPCISMIHLSLHTNKCTKLIYYLNSVLIIHIKTLYSFVTPTCFDTLCVIIREHTFFLAKVID